MSIWYFINWKFKTQILIRNWHIFVFILLFIFSSNRLFSDKIKFGNHFVSKKKFIKGYMVKNSKVHFPKYEILDLKEKPIDLSSIINNNHKFYLFIICSPYGCINCEQMRLIGNILAKRYPEQIFGLIEFWDKYDVEEKLKGKKFNNNFRLFLDPKGKNIIYITENLDKSFLHSGLIIIDNNKNINYLYLQTFQNSSSSIKKVYKKIITFLDK